MKKVRHAVLYLIKQVIVPNLIWLALISIPSSVAGIVRVGRTFFAFASEQDIPTTELLKGLLLIYVLVSVFVLAVGFSIHYFVHRKKHFPTFERNYRIRTSEYELYFKSREEIVQRQSATIEPLVDGLEQVRHSMSWTGDAYIGSDLDENSKCRGLTLTDSKRSHPPHTIFVNFPQSLKRGDEGRYKVETRVSDNSHSMLPHLTKIVKCQTEHLIMKVTAPAGMLRNVRCSITADATRSILLEPERPIPVNTVGELELYEWELDDLELLHCYNICWDFYAP